MAKRYIYIEIRDYLIELITKNKDNPSYTLPSEAQLSSKFGVSRVSVRNAFRILEKKNYIKRKQGKGTFINVADEIINETRNLDNIALIIPKANTRFNTEIIDGIKSFCENRDINLFIMLSCNNPDIESELVKNCAVLQCKGIIVFPTDYELYNEEILRLSLKKFPIVLIDRKFKGHNINCVVTDHYAILYDTMRILREKNYNNITLITTQLSRSSAEEERIHAFQHGMLDFFGMLTSRNILSIKDYLDPELEKIYFDFISLHPDTEVFIVNSGIAALTLIKVIKKHNPKSTHKIQFVFFDEELNDVSGLIDINPFLIVQDTFKIGFRAAELLYNQMYGSYKLIIEKLPAKVIEYNSLTPPPLIC